jgi:NADP-dependent 3-hydroxy acid dehydrogenase YdfG
VLCKPDQRLVRHGHYLITGGLGRIGLRLAMMLAKDYQARITLMSRRDIPPQTDGEQINGVLSRIRALGADVQVIQADVSRLEELERGVSGAEQTFGRLNGIIHAAGVVQNSTVPLRQTDEAACDRQYASKVAGLIHLERILRTRTVDFCSVMSSLSVELGGLGFAAYAAANSFSNAFVHRMRNAGQDHWSCVDWDGWSFSSNDGPSFGAERAMSPDEGTRAFAVAMCHVEHPSLINSTTDLNRRFEKWVRLSVQQSRPQNVHGRANISQEFQAPTTRTQEVLAGLWQDILGLEHIGIDDNFFQLGGDSLIATRLVAKIRTHFAVSDAVYSLSDFFANPTIGAIADKIDGGSLIAALEAKRRQLQHGAGVEKGVF